MLKIVAVARDLASILGGVVTVAKAADESGVIVTPELTLGDASEEGIKF